MSTILERARTDRDTLGAAAAVLRSYHLATLAAQVSDVHRTLAEHVADLEHDHARTLGDHT